MAEAQPHHPEIDFASDEVPNLHEILAAWRAWLARNADFDFVR